MLKGIITFINSLTFIDYVFFFTVIFLLVLIISLIYFIKINEEVIDMEEKVKDPDNLNAIVNIMKKESKPINFTSYEQDQEEKAIISYEELLSNKEAVELNYIDDEKVNNSDVLVRKFDLNNLVTKVEKQTEEKIDVHLFTLHREEEFLRSLKEFEKALY